MHFLGTFIKVHSFLPLWHVIAFHLHSLSFQFNISLITQNYRRTIVSDVNERDNRKLIIVHHILHVIDIKVKKEEKHVIG